MALLELGLYAVLNADVSRNLFQFGSLTKQNCFNFKDILEELSIN